MQTSIYLFPVCKGLNLYMCDIFSKSEMLMILLGPSIPRKLREPLPHYSPEDSPVHYDSIIDSQPKA